MKCLVLCPAGGGSVHNIGVGTCQTSKSYLNK